MVEKLSIPSNGKIAVLIGISDYSELCLNRKDEDSPNMIYCLQDLRCLKNSLRNYNFDEILLLENSTTDELRLVF